MRVYLPTTLPALREQLRTGAVPAAEAFTAESEDEQAEYLALMSAADASAALLDGPGRRVVVVAEVDDLAADVDLRSVVAVHADPHDRPVGADPDEELAWYATQEIEELLQDD